MNLSKELLEKAKTAKTAEELLKIAKAEGTELTAGQAEAVFAGLNRSGELSDTELGGVAGGSENDYAPRNPKFKYLDRVVIPDWGRLTSSGWKHYVGTVYRALFFDGDVNNYLVHFDHESVDTIIGEDELDYAPQE